MSADGSGQRKLADVGLGAEPMAWSPDGKKIVFTGQPGDLYAINADDSGQRKIAKGNSAAWSPEGTKIAFEGADGIYGMNADGTGQHRLADGRFSAWSPDERKIAFEAGAQGSRNSGIYVMNADGSRRRQLNDLGYSTAGTIAWQPAHSAPVARRPGSASTPIGRGAFGRPDAPPAASVLIARAALPAVLVVRRSLRVCADVVDCGGDSCLRTRSGLTLSLPSLSERVALAATHARPVDVDKTERRTEVDDGHRAAESTGRGKQSFAQLVSRW